METVRRIVERLGLLQRFSSRRLFAPVDHRRPYLKPPTQGSSVIFQRQRAFGFPGRALDAADQIQDAGDVSYRKMFGEYALYCNGNVVALVYNNQLFVKP